jgi:pyridoxine kinase
MAILSIQSHVVYGYVGNKAAVYPLQSMGYDVWSVNTVQFSNHTGYGKWQGEVFSREHIHNLIKGIEDLGRISSCQAILSGYMGSRDICLEVEQTVKHFKIQNPNIIYLCDPVIGNTSCFVRPEVLEFFKTNLKADIITPNQYEAETLSGIKLLSKADIKKSAEYFHNLGVKIVIITGIELGDEFFVLISDQGRAQLIHANKFLMKTSVSGMGDIFSALFLGHYLKSGNSLEAARAAVYFMEIILQHTLATNSRELNIVGRSYADVSDEILPKTSQL